MRNSLISAAIIALLGATSLAIAQDRGRDGGDRGQHVGGREGGENRTPRPSPQTAPQAAPQTAPQAAPNSGAMNGRSAIGERQFREHHDVPSPARQAAPARPTPAAQAQTPAGAAAQQMRDINRAIGNAPQPNAGRQDSNRPDNNNRPDFRGQDNRRDDRDRDRGRDNDRRDFNNNRRPDFNNGPGRRDYSNYRNYHQNFRASQRFRAAPYRRPPGYFARRWSWGQTLPGAFWTRDYWLTDFDTYDLQPPPYGAIWVRVGEDALLIDQYSGEIIEVDYGVFY